METIDQCKRCGKPISLYLQSIQKKQDSTDWVKYGYCSHTCFEEDPDRRNESGITDKSKPESDLESPETRDKSIVEAETKPKVSTKTKLDNEIDHLKKTKTWLAVIGTSNSYSIYDNEQIDTDLKQHILEGKYNDEIDVTTHHADKEDKWEKSTLKLAELIKAHFKLRVLYQPILAHSLQGLKWGAIIGVILKLMDTIILFASVDPMLAVLIVVAIGVVFIPRIGWIGVAIVAFFIGKISGMNIFLTVIVSALVGAILGILPGLSIGGIIGFLKRKNITLAPDAEPESANKMFLKVILLPILGGALLLYLYIAVFNPWLMSIME